MGETVDTRLARLETTTAGMAVTLTEVRSLLADLSRDNAARIRALENDLAAIRGDHGQHVAFVRGAAWLAGLLWFVVAAGLGTMLTEWRAEDKRQSAAIVDLRRDIDVGRAIATGRK